MTNPGVSQTAVSSQTLKQLPPLPAPNAQLGGAPAVDVLRDKANELLPELQELRRDLHAHPELGNHLPETQARVLRELEGLPLEVIPGIGVSSVVAVLRGGKRGDHPVSVLLRADMDGLEVTERTGMPYAAKNGNMHACGHDLHTSALVGAAKVLCEVKEDIQGDIIFMFQPGEEGPGGARPMIEEGVLDAAGRRPIAAYGIHVGPQDFGNFYHHPGPMMASSSNLQVTVLGKGGHGSRPHDAIDPVAALAEIQVALQTAVTRRFDALNPVVITVTKLWAGDGAINAIPDKAGFFATVRVLDDTAIDRVRQVITEVTTNVAAAHRCSVDIEFEILYPTTKTNPRENAFAAGVWARQFGADRVLPLGTPMMASEDFGVVLQQVPGTFVWLGTADAHVPYAKREWNHSPLARFDDHILGDQAAALAAVAVERLAAEESHPSPTIHAARQAAQQA
ncbi:iron permease [Corynebacterium phocae]|uniref:Iron permease n=1 Tax=Corynebacterium phocae TaxID=161895 RepID=A0A1L7D1Q9_9CORY|nr:M20 family metallopeptidase [Corynebacterium phocae]APT92096.1 iron permease [Corynebacterium phocae]KAA8726479.1 amidohydrolase [Corynebacterium phocae]